MCESRSPEGEGKPSGRLRPDSLSFKERAGVRGYSASEYGVTAVKTISSAFVKNAAGEPLRHTMICNGIGALSPGGAGGRPAWPGNGRLR
jgi:hypothetical protein